MEGVDLMTIRELMGHKSMAMTLRYAHLSPGHQRTAIERLVTRNGWTPAHKRQERSSTVISTGALYVSRGARQDCTQLFVTAARVVGSPGRTRTCDILINSQALYRLS